MKEKAHVKSANMGFRTTERLTLTLQVEQPLKLLPPSSKTNLEVEEDFDQMFAGNVSTIVPLLD